MYIIINVNSYIGAITRHHITIIGHIGLTIVGKYPLDHKLAIQIIIYYFIKIIRTFHNTLNCFTEIFQNNGYTFFIFTCTLALWSGNLSYWSGKKY